MKILITAKYISGSANEGGSSRFLHLVGKTLHELGHEVTMSPYPKDHVAKFYDLIICSHHIEDIKKNPAHKVFISHGWIPDEYMNAGADRYISVSEEVQKFNRERGFESDIIPQPIEILKPRRPHKTLSRILIIRRYPVDPDPFAFLSEKYDVRVSDLEKPIERQIAWADLVVTLGRGALEAMAQGKCVLVADNRAYIGAFGDGYVTRDNIDEIAKHNFSGRRFKHHLTREWIEGELAKYDAADSDFLYAYVSEKHDVKKIVVEYLKSKQIHLVIPFWRKTQKNVLIEAYRPMGIHLHPIMFEDEVVDWKEPWIHPVVIPEKFEVLKDRPIIPGNYKRNWFIKHCPVIDNDYYVCADDDDMYEPGVMAAIKKHDEDIVVISMKRGQAIPGNVAYLRRYCTNTLEAHPDNIKRGQISGQQSFVKGRVFREHPFSLDSGTWDGEMAMHHKADKEVTAYRPDLFALFNYYEPGRWVKEPKLTFGVLVNDRIRFDMVLRRSQIQGDVRFLEGAESATKGLNKLLDMMEQEQTDIAVLTHQDMYYTAGWLPQVREQIKLLPDNWIVAGVVGKDVQGRICGKFQDMRIPLHFDTSNYHEFPHPAVCFDECCLIINMASGFRFDEDMAGWDLYGTLAVLQAWEMGGSAWVLDAYCEHYCLRPFTWTPGKGFRAAYKWLHNRYSKIYKLDSTAIGLPKEAMRFETSAA